MSSKGKRSSILKKRPSVDPGSLEASPSETTATLKSAKRIGFKPKKSVKEFFASDETATIWCNSYELSTDGTPSHLTINDTTQNMTKLDNSLLGTSECDRKDKENVEDRRISPNNSSIWNLSVSASEEERRRMRGEVSVNSSVLNVTDRLFLEPAIQRPVMRQKQSLKIADSIAMDVSPVKCEGKSSPRKTIYYHPKQNIFVTIDDVPVHNRNGFSENRVPNDTDINFFGPPEASASVTQEEPIKILFQTSSIPNSWRNKLIQTEPRSSTVEKRSLAVNTDHSAGWSSQVAEGEFLAQRNTFGNSQFDISEAWNSHPTAALKLKLLQQGLPPTAYNSRFSDEGGGAEEDIDSTIAITQTVAKMLGPGSRPISLESSRDVIEENKQEPMETSMIVEEQCQNGTTAVGDILLLEESCDEQIPSNSLSRARPFIPSVIPMDESECSSSELIESLSCKRRGLEKHSTLPDTNPTSILCSQNAEKTLLNVSNMHLDVQSPPRSIPTTSRRTVICEENIPNENQGYLTIPESAANTPPRPQLRPTVYEDEMDESHVKQSAPPPIEKINMNLSDLVFCRNSVGLDLVIESDPKQEANRPKLHRMPPRPLNYNTRPGITAKKDSEKASCDKEEMCVDTQENIWSLNSNSRKTTNLPLDVTLDLDTPKDAKKSQKQPRQTIYAQEVIDLTCATSPLQLVARKTDYNLFDVSMQSPAGEPDDAGTKRTTICMRDDINQTTPEQIVEVPFRPTILLNENLDDCKLEPRSGSLEDLRKYGHSRRTDGDFIAIETSDKEHSQANTRKTITYAGEMEYSLVVGKECERNSRLKVISSDVQSIDETIDFTRPNSVDQAQRKTLSFGSEMDESKTMFSPQQSVEKHTKDNCRKAIPPISEMDYSSPAELQCDKALRPNVISSIGQIMEETNDSARRKSVDQAQRITTNLGSEMDESKTEQSLATLLLPKNSAKKNKQGGSRKTVENVAEMELSSLVEKEYGRTSQYSSIGQVMDETIDFATSYQADRAPHKTASCGSEMDESKTEDSPTAPQLQQKARQTFTARESMDEITTENLKKEARPQQLQSNIFSRRGTDYSCEDMNETRSDLCVTSSVIVPNSNYDRPQITPVRKLTQTSHSICDNDEKIPIVRMSDRITVLDKTLGQTRPTCFTVENIEQTVSPSKLLMLHKNPCETRLSTFSPVGMDETVVSDCCKPNDQGKTVNLVYKSRHTNFVVENMDETSDLSEKLPSPKSYQTVLRDVDMGQTLSSNIRTSAIVEQTYSQASPVNSTANDFELPLPQKSCPVSFVEVEELTNPVKQSNIFQQVDMEQSPKENSLKMELSYTAVSQHALNKSCQTSYIEGYFQKSSTCGSSGGRSTPDKTRQTMYDAKELDESDPTLKSVPHSIQAEQLLTFDQSLIDKKRGTIFCNDDIDETFSTHHLVVPSRNKLAINSTTDVPTATSSSILPQVAMAEITVNVQKETEKKSAEEMNKTCAQSELQPSRQTNSRKTIYSEDDMEQTAVGHPFTVMTALGLEDMIVDVNVRRKKFSPSVGEKSTHELPENVVDGVSSLTSKSPEHATLRNRTQRQTVLVPQDMESSLVNTTEIPVIPSPRICAQPLRRTIVQVDNIVEESFNRDINQEQADSAVYVETPSDVDHEDDDKSDFMFTIPQLPDDCVLRSAAVMPYYRMTKFSNQTLKASPRLLHSEGNNALIDISSVGRRTAGAPVSMLELSEISGLGDVPRLTRSTTFAVPDNVCSLELNELTEPSIVQLPLVVTNSVIQETPKKAGSMSVRRSRGSIFDRKSMNLDESGILPIECEDQGHRQITSKQMKPCDSRALATSEMKAIVTRLVSTDYESSEDEFYDAEASQENLKGDKNEEVAHVAHEAIAQNNKSENPMFTNVDDIEQSIIAGQNRTTAGYKTIDFVDVDELEQIAQKRHLSCISKSVLIKQKNDPLNVSLTDDYPMKKRKTTAAHDLSKDCAVQMDEDRNQASKSIRRVAFHQDVLDTIERERDIQSSIQKVIKPAEVESIIIKNERMTIIENDCEAEQSKLGHTMLIDPSIFIVEEHDMLANESNISLVTSPNAQNNRRGSTLKFDNTYYNEFAHLTLNMDQEESHSCIIISDDSFTEPARIPPSPVEVKLTLVDLPKRIEKSRASMEFNSTVASEVMYELRRQQLETTTPCCNFEGNCRCQNRRTMAAVRQNNVASVKDGWKSNFERLLESSKNTPVYGMPLDERLREILNRAMKPLPLSCLEQQSAHLPDTPSIWLLCDYYKRSTTLSDIPRKLFNPSDLPRTPNVISLISNKLESERYRWFLDSTNESRTYLKLRHGVLRTVYFKIILQKPLPWYSKDDDVRIEGLECIQYREHTIRSPRLLLAHLEFKLIVDKINLIQLSSHCSSVAHLMSLVVELNVLIEQAFGRVDQLYRIVRNNGAIMEQLGDTSRLRIFKVFEYEWNGVIYWNRVSIQFESVDRIDRSCVSFHASGIREEGLYPTEYQCGTAAARGLVFLECLLWNIEKLSIV
ncbi:uncharacterized protein LOC131693580 [Topomyia yanbarensis]|uniref:uncharacterized protein LOC131693580 n=1 Tax=Topomyia yanbarensis TaxID=2498891 RepID=UPI00273C3DC4|nr:uncharacterized protein LOC131693580 [Topomyia yanbarensis]